MIANRPTSLSRDFALYPALEDEEISALTRMFSFLLTTVTIGVIFDGTHLHKKGKSQLLATDFLSANTLTVAWR